MDGPGVFDEAIAGRPEFIGLMMTGFLETMSCYVMKFRAPLTNEQIAAINTFVQRHEGIACATPHARDDEMVVVACTGKDAKERSVITWLQNAFQPEAPFTGCAKVFPREQDAVAELVMLGRQPTKAQLDEIAATLRGNEHTDKAMVHPDARRLLVSFPDIPADSADYGNFFSWILGSQPHFGVTVLVMYGLVDITDNTNQIINLLEGA